MPDISPEVKTLQIVGFAYNELSKERSAIDSNTAEAKQLDNILKTLWGQKNAIIDKIISDTTEKFKEHIASLATVNQELLTTIGNTAKIAETLKTMVKFIDEVTKIVGMVTASPVSAFMAVAPLVAMEAEAKIAASPARELLEAESVEAPQASSVEEKNIPLTLEEVLYRVELTPAKLIITVDAGLNRPVEVVFRNKLNS